MREPRDLEEIKEDVADRQRNIFWEDARRGSTSVDAFLWKGDPNAKPVQRAGLVVFGICFSLLAVCLASIPFQKDSEGGWAIELLAPDSDFDSVHPQRVSAYPKALISRRAERAERK